MKNYSRWFSVLLFFVLVLTQWMFTGNMLVSHNAVLVKGKSFRFRTEPIDPVHPFIGRYVYLNFKENKDTVSYAEGQRMQDKIRDANDEIYVLLGEDKDGFAFVKDIDMEPPETGNYVKAKYNGIYRLSDVMDTGLNRADTNRSVITIDYPFDKFYMEEYKAPKAETVYRNANLDTSGVCYALVKVYHGDAITENVFIDNKPISDFIRK